MAQDLKARQVFNELKTAKTTDQYKAIMLLFKLLAPAGRTEDTRWYMDLNQVQQDGGFFFASGAFNTISARTQREGNNDKQLLEGLEFESLGQNNRFTFVVPTLRLWQAGSPDFSEPRIELAEADMESRITTAKAIHEAALKVEARRLLPAYRMTGMESKLRGLVGIRF